MENKFTFPNILIKMKYNKIKYSRLTHNIKSLINHFMLLLWLPIELDI